MAGLGFDVDESSAFKNKQGGGQDLVGALAATNAAKKLSESPAATTAGFLGGGLARGAALPFAATMDVLNKGVNATGQFFGFNPGLSTDNTSRVSDMSGSQPNPLPTTPPTAPTTAPPIHTPGGFIPTMAPSHTPGEVVDVKQPQNAFSGTSPVVMLNGKNLGDTTAISNRVDWTPGGVNASAAEGIAGVNVKPSPFTSYSTQAQTDELGRALPDKVVTQNSVLSNRGIAGLTYNEQVAKAAQVNAAAQRDLMLMSPREQAAAEVADNANFGAFIRGGAKGDLAAYEARRNAIGEKQKTDAVLEGERIKGEFGMKTKAGDLEISRLDREARRESALEVAALKAEENRETTLGVTKLKMDESRTEKELAAEKELRKGKVELAVPDATTAGTDIETAIAAREIGLEARGVKKNMFGSITEPAGFYDKKTGKLVDAATIKGMRGKTTGSSAADIAASLRSQGKTAEQIKAELIAQGFKPGTR